MFKAFLISLTLALAFTNIYPNDYDDCRLAICKSNCIKKSGSLVCNPECNYCDIIKNKIINVPLIHNIYTQIIEEINKLYEQKKNTNNQLKITSLDKDISNKEIQRMNFSNFIINKNITIKKYSEIKNYNINYLQDLYIKSINNKDYNLTQEIPNFCHNIIDTGTKNTCYYSLININSSSSSILQNQLLTPVTLNDEVLTTFLNTFENTFKKIYIPGNQTKAANSMLINELLYELIKKYESIKNAKSNTKDLYIQAVQETSNFLLTSSNYFLIYKKICDSIISNKNTLALEGIKRALTKAPVIKNIGRISLSSFDSLTSLEEALK